MNQQKVYQALYLHDMEKLQKAIERGWDPKVAGPEGQSALHEASLIGAAGIIEPLVKKGADVNGLSDDGDTALILAVSSAAIAAKELLEVVSVDELEVHERLAWSAARGQPVDTVRALVRAGADVNGVGADGLTPLMVAIQQGSPELVKVLLELGADATARNAARVTAVSLAQRGRYKHPEITAMVLEAQPVQLGLGGLDIEESTPTAKRSSPKR